MTARVESQLTALTAASKTPGIQYLAVTSAGVLFEHASGWADIRRRVPVDAATSMMAYSTSKTITTVAVLQLVQTDRVGLDEPALVPVEKQCPGGPQFDSKWWIKHMLWSEVPDSLRLSVAGRASAKSQTTSARCWRQLASTLRNCRPSPSSGDNRDGPRTETRRPSRRGR